MKKEVISLMATKGTNYIVEVNLNEDQTTAKILKVISVNSEKPKSNSVPDGKYQHGAGFYVSVQSNVITMNNSKAGVPPKALFTGIAKVRADNEAKRKQTL